MQQNELTLLLGEAYYREALLCAHNSEWDGCREYLRGMSSLLPMDHRAAVLHAQVLLREGHLGASLASLQVAKDLGHDAAENDRMAVLILRWDEKKYTQLKRRIARRRFIRGCKRNMVRLTVNAVTSTYGAIRTSFAGIMGLFAKKSDQEKVLDVEAEEPITGAGSESTAEHSETGDLLTDTGSASIPTDGPEESVDAESDKS